MKQSTPFLLLLVFLLFLSNSLWAQNRLRLEEFASGLDLPVDITHAGDDRLFVVEKRGFIRVLESDGSLVEKPFLDIDSLVNSGASERGLLGLAFHPNYAENGYFFVNYTDNSGQTQVSRFKVSPDNPDVADASSQKKILNIFQPFTNHNGGDLAFGPDGYLYIGTGDGGSGGDPQNSGQTRTSLLGKMLRIDINTETPYAIPEDNPFANTDFTLDEVWALGLRNPWRFSFDRLTGDLWIGDVGQNSWEEIDLQLANSPGGENYGWRCYEGNNTFNTNDCADASTLTFPVHAYENSFSVGCSVTGGFVYRGSDFPDLVGHYVYADFCTGRIWSLSPDGADGWINREWLDGANGEYSSFGQDQNGELYLAAYGNGDIYRVVDQCKDLIVQPEVDFVSCTGANDGRIVLNVEDPSANFSVSWSGGESGTMLESLQPGEYTYTVTNDWGCSRTEVLFIMEPFPEVVTIAANGNLLSVADSWESFQWLLNGDTIPGANQPKYTATASGDYSVVVSDGSGCTFVSQILTVMVNGTADELVLPGLNISPNPTSSSFWIHLAAEVPANLQLRLVDQWGRTHLRSILVKEGLEVSIEHLPSGIYFLTLETEEKRLTRKILKE